MAYFADRKICMSHGIKGGRHIDHVKTNTCDYGIHVFEFDMEKNMRLIIVKI